MMASLPNTSWETERNNQRGIRSRSVQAAGRLLLLRSPTSRSPVSPVSPTTVRSGQPILLRRRRGQERFPVAIWRSHGQAFLPAAKALSISPRLLARRVGISLARGRAFLPAGKRSCPRPRPLAGTERARAQICGPARLLSQPRAEEPPRRQERPLAPSERLCPRGSALGARKARSRAEKATWARLCPLAGSYRCCETPAR